jgi:NDP-sugar pyrophosphorylase family protein
MPKPLVPVAGMPLIEHVIRNFLAAGISSLVIIVNEQARDSLISTVDAWCPEEAFVTFVRTARLFPSHAIVLAVTPFVDDERPLWVNLDASGRVTHLGGDAGDAVTAGMYLVPEQVRRMSPPPEVKRLREFLVWLLNRGEPVYGVRLPVVVDVDRGRDVSLAETLAHRGGGPGSSEQPVVLGNFSGTRPFAGAGI